MADTVLNDEVFVAQFENQTLPPEHFNHLGHLRIGWLYLNQYELETSIDLVCTGIKCYAESLGASDKFHYTITDAIMRIMADRMAQQSSNNWQDFLSENQDLLEDALSLIHQHYSETLLASEDARLKVLQPDRQVI